MQLMTWGEAQAVAAPMRFAIFVGEQNVPPGIELDELDEKSLHAVAFDEAGKAIGTGRLLPEGKIGRMAVVKEWRRRGVGVRGRCGEEEDEREQFHLRLLCMAWWRIPASS